MNLIKESNQVHHGKKGPVPLEYAITGLGPVFIRIANFSFFKEVLEKVLLFKEVAQEGEFYLFEVNEGGNGASVIVEHNTVLPEARQGFGTVHHACIPRRRSRCIRRMDRENQ